MGFFALTATLTNAGKTLIDTAKANNQLVKADQISFGDFTGALSAATTSIGNLLDTAGHITQATNLTFTRAEFQCLFKGRPTDKVGTVGIYSGGVLLAVARVTVESIVKGNTQLALRLDYANASVFAKPISSVAASLLADIHKKAYDDTAAYLQSGNVVGNKAFFGTANGKEADWFCSFVNIVADQAEFTALLAKNPAEGTVAYSLQDSKKYVLTSGAWVQQATGVLSDVVKPGRFYRSDLTLSVYYARTSNDLLRVYKFADMTADIVFSLTGTTVAKTLSMIAENVTLDYFFDNNTAPVRKTSTGNVSVPVGASKMYVRFVPASINTNSNFGVINNDVIESVLDWSTYGLPKLSFVNSISLVNVPNTYLPPTIRSLASSFSGCVKFAPMSLNWNTGAITNFSRCFENCEKFNASLPWNMISATDLSYMFSGCKLFNSNVNAWDVRNVTTIRGIFAGCTVFNQPLNTWSHYFCTDHSFAFQNCAAFNQSVNAWSMNYSTTAQSMFEGCTAFNQPLGNWRIGNESMNVNALNMFRNCVAFNQPLTNWYGGYLTNIMGMFYGASVFNQNLSTWTISANIPRAGYDTGATAWIAGNKPQFIA